MAEERPAENGVTRQPEYDRGEWYNPKLDNLSDGTRQVLEMYSKITSDQVIPHLFAIVRYTQAQVPLERR